MSTLTVKHIADAIAALEAVRALPYNPSPALLGAVQGRAVCAAIALRINSGLDQIKIEVKQD